MYFFFWRTFDIFYRVSPKQANVFEMEKQNKTKQKQDSRKEAIRDRENPDLTEWHYCTQ